MSKKIIFNIALLFSIYVMPFYLVYTSQDSAIRLGKIQTPALLVIFFGSILLIYLNNRYRKSDLNRKWLWVIFEVIGIIGLCYSAFILFLIFSFRNLLS